MDFSCHYYTFLEVYEQEVRDIYFRNTDLLRQSRDLLAEIAEAGGIEITKIVKEKKERVITIPIPF